MRGHVEGAWARAVDKGKLTSEAVESARHRLKIIQRLKDATEVDFLIEAVPEAIELKQMLFSELDDLCPPRTILASNTSSLSITRIATARRAAATASSASTSSTPSRPCPSWRSSRGRETSAETEGRALELVRSLGKEAVRVHDSPGFATSRLGVALGLEAMRMVEEGISSAEDIDRAIELGYGHRMGPLKTTDLVGLDVRLAIAETLAAELSAERFTPPEILQTLVAEGRTGKKAGEGFYRWDGDKAAGPAPRAAELAKKR